MRAHGPLLLLLFFCGCGVELEIQTAPVSQAIPASPTVGIEAYAEVALDVPSQLNGDIQVKQVLADGVVHNPTATTMTLSLRLSDQGTASPGQPLLFTSQNPPAYFGNALVLLAPEPFSSGDHPLHISSSTVGPYFKKQRVWLILGNNVSRLGVGGLSGLELDVQNLVLEATVQKSLGELAPAGEAAGL